MCESSVGSLRQLWPIIAFGVLLVAAPSRAGDWLRWRGADGSGVSQAIGLPTEWSATKNIRWKAEIPGEGSSSPIVFGDRVYLTSATERGTKRHVHCLDGKTGKILWTRTIADENPEITSAVTGHAAATPVTDGKRVIAFFGNAGTVCYDIAGKKLWQRSFGEFDTELGLASSPIIDGNNVILLCDHDGDRFRTFDSFLIALDIRTGKTVWKTDRPKLFRSWSTPLLITAKNDRRELIVNAQDALRAYDPKTGKELWHVTGMTGWVTPSPVFANGLLFATSGKTGPVMAIRPGGKGDVTKTHVVWKHERVGPYVCSPVVYRGLLYVHNEAGVLSCYESATGKLVYRKRLDGKFWSSSFAADGKIYITSEAGKTFVIQAGKPFKVLARNSLGKECVASPAVIGSDLLLRDQQHLYRVTRSE